jgi:hypothetical protein
MWLQDGCKVYMASYMAPNGSCFVVTWIMFKTRLLEVGLTWNREIMALRTLSIVGLFYCVMCEDPHEQKFIEIAFGWGYGHVWLHTTLEGMLTTLHDFGGVLGRFLGTYFGLSQFHGHGSWLVCEVALTHENEGMWPLHFKHSHWWEKVGQSKFTSHHARGTTRVSARWM